MPNKETVKRECWKYGYANGAFIKVCVMPPPRNWKSVEPRDVIRLSFHNKQYLGRQTEAMIMRPDEAEKVIKLLKIAIKKQETMEDRFDKLFEKYRARYKHRGIIHKIAHCRDCDWIEDGYKVSQRMARKHCSETGHTIDIETGTWGEMIAK